MDCLGQKYSLGAPSQHRRTEPQPVVVSDDCASLQPWQMPRTEFLAALTRATMSGLDGEVAVERCPLLGFWLKFYSRQPAEHINATIVKFVPEASSAASAQKYIEMLAVRLREGIVRAATDGLGKVKDVG